MELRHIDIGKLTVSPANMRAKGKTPDIANILPSVRARGVLVPLIVRANGSADTYEIVAGKRRYHAALAVAEEGGGIEALPCAVIEAGDDAAALEASLIENIARLDPDEVTRWETFTRLVREGRSVEDIALTFGLTELQVKRTLALGNLLPRIRGLYRADEIDAVTMRHLTLASRARQREWLALLDSADAYAPVGQQLKAWLLGGASIATSAALFDLAGFDGEIVADLFGEDSYFADAGQFWAAQNAAIAQRAADYREAGWDEVVVLGPGEPFCTWEYERLAKGKGGKVYIATGHRGDVTFHEGYIGLKEARRVARGEAVEKSARPEIAAATNDYVDLHRHAAVRARLTGAPGAALRVAVAHMIAGSPLWSVRVEPQRCCDGVAESVENSCSEAQFDAERRRLLALLDFDPDSPTIAQGGGTLTEVYARLAALDDETVMAILAVVMGETLDARCDLVDALGLQLGIDMAEVWQADDALLESIRDREVVDALLAEVAGASVAEANAKETGKVKRSIIRDCLAGANGREKREGWVPRWMRFPATGYTERGGIGSVRRSASAAGAMAGAAQAEVDAGAEGEPAPVAQAA